MRIRWKLLAVVAGPAVTLAGSGYGLFVSELSAEAVATFRDTTLPWVMLAFGAVVLLSIALAGIVSISITRPLRQMREAVTQVGRGDFTVRAGEVDKRGEMGELARAFNAMTSELGLRVEELTRSNADNEVVEGELRAARRIQASLLPTTFPPFPERPEFELFASNAPATHVGGDFYDFFFRSEHELVIVMADVSGKGVPAALLMAVSRTIIHNLGVQGLAPERILSETNRRLVADSIGSMYVTAFVAIYDTRNCHIRYANGAHLAPLRVTTDGRVETVAEPTGTLVGILEDCEYTQDTCCLALGELLVLFTDGVTEARALGGEFFGEAPLRRLLTAYADAPPRFLCELIEREVNAFQGGERSGDLTLLMLRRNS